MTSLLSAKDYQDIAGENASSYAEIFNKALSKTIFGRGVQSFTDFLDNCTVGLKTRREQLEVIKYEADIICIQLGNRDALKHVSSVMPQLIKKLG